MFWDLTQIEATDYLDTGFSCCPFAGCKSTDVVGDFLDVDGKIVTQDVTCQKCGRSWRDFYELKYVQALNND